jgi:hypothetical protein
LDFGFGWVTEGELRGDRVGGSLRVGVRDEIWGDGMWWMKYGGWNVVDEIWGDGMWWMKYGGGTVLSM